MGWGGLFKKRFSTQIVDLHWVAYYLHLEHVEDMITSIMEVQITSFIRFYAKCNAEKAVQDFYSFRTKQEGFFYTWKWKNTKDPKVFWQKQVSIDALTQLISLIRPIYSLLAHEILLSLPYISTILPRTLYPARNPSQR